MRRRFYGKPLPAKRQVRAHLALLDLVKKADDMNKMRIELHNVETGYLLRLVSADYQRMNALMDHAICHGAEVVLPDFDTAGDLLRILENEKA